MKIYILQIHNNEMDEVDQLFIFENFDNLCKEFEKQFKHFKVMCDEMISETYPVQDDNGDVWGKFAFGNADGSLTTGVVSDYHVLDA